MICEPVTVIAVIATKSSGRPAECLHISKSLHCLVVRLHQATDDIIPVRTFVRVVFSGYIAAAHHTAMTGQSFTAYGLVRLSKQQIILCYITLNGNGSCTNHDIEECASPKVHQYAQHAPPLDGVATRQRLGRYRAWSQDQMAAKFRYHCYCQLQSTVQGSGSLMKAIAVEAAVAAVWQLLPETRHGHQACCDNMLFCTRNDELQASMQESGSAVATCRCHRQHATTVSYA